MIIGVMNSVGDTMCRLEYDGKECPIDVLISGLYRELERGDADLNIGLAIEALEAELDEDAISVFKVGDVHQWTYCSIKVTAK